MQSVTHARTHERTVPWTDRPKPICLLNFFEAGDISMNIHPGRVTVKDCSPPPQINNANLCQCAFIYLRLIVFTSGGHSKAYHMSHVTRTFVFGIITRLKPVCSATETSWSLETLDVASIHIILSKQRSTKMPNICCLYMA